MDKRYSRILRKLKAQGHVHFRDTNRDALEAMIVAWKEGGHLPFETRLTCVGAGRTWTMMMSQRERIIEHSQPPVRRTHLRIYTVENPEGALTNPELDE